MTLSTQTVTQPVRNTKEVNPDGAEKNRLCDLDQLAQFRKLKFGLVTKRSDVKSISLMP